MTTTKKFVLASTKKTYQTDPPADNASAFQLTVQTNIVDDNGLASFFREIYYGLKEILKIKVNPQTQKISLNFYDYNFQEINFFDININEKTNPNELSVYENLNDFFYNATGAGSIVPVAQNLQNVLTVGNTTGKDIVILENYSGYNRSKTTYKNGTISHEDVTNENVEREIKLSKRDTLRINEDSIRFSHEIFYRKLRDSIMYPNNTESEIMVMSNTKIPYSINAYFEVLPNQDYLITTDIKFCNVYDKVTDDEQIISLVKQNRTAIGKYRLVAPNPFSDYDVELRPTLRMVKKNTLNGEHLEFGYIKVFADYRGANVWFYDSEKNLSDTYFEGKTLVEIDFYKIKY